MISPARMRAETRRSSSLLPIVVDWRTVHVVLAGVFGALVSGFALLCLVAGVPTVWVTIVWAGFIGWVVLGPPRPSVFDDDPDERIPGDW